MPPPPHRNRKPAPRARSIIAVSQARGGWGEVQLAALGACKALSAAADPRLAAPEQQTVLARLTRARHRESDEQIQE